MWLWTCHRRQLRRVDRQSCTGLIIMLLPPDSFGECIVFRLSRSFVCMSFRPVRYCCHDISRTAWTISIKMAGNIHSRLLMTWLDSGVQRSRSHLGSSMFGRRHPLMPWHRNPSFWLCFYCVVTSFGLVVHGLIFSVPSLVVMCGNNILEIADVYVEWDVKPWLP